MNTAAAGFVELLGLSALVAGPILRIGMPVADSVVVNFQQVLTDEVHRQEDRGYLTAIIEEMRTGLVNRLAEPGDAAVDDARAPRRGAGRR